MAVPKATAKNLETLGASRLAELLLMFADDADGKRLLRIALAELSGPEALSGEVSKRLRAISRRTGVIDGKKSAAMLRELAFHQTMITERLIPAAANLGVDALWELLDAAKTVSYLIYDDYGKCGKLLTRLVADLAEAEQKRAGPVEPLAVRVDALLFDTPLAMGEVDLALFAPALGREGLLALRKLVETRRAQHPGGRAGMGVYQGGGRVRQPRQDFVDAVLLRIADALGDVDGALALIPKDVLQTAIGAAGGAHRLLEAGRTDEALALLLAVEDPEAEPLQSVVTYLDVLAAAFMAKDRIEEARATWLRSFEISLFPDHLRAFLKSLPDFDDVEAEDEILDQLANGEDAQEAELYFLLRWPSLDRAARLVRRRAGQWNGDSYELFNEAIEALSERHPLAAVILCRTMIDYNLEVKHTARYRHGARHLADCAGMDVRITDYDGLDDHAAYLAALKKKHGRKYSFWKEVEAK